jgi:hypothetical protein
MTARDDTHAEGENPTPRVQTANAQLVLDCLDSVGSTTFQSLAARTDLTEAILREVLDDLQESGHVDVHTGFSTVRVERVHQPVAPDGGVVQRVVDGLDSDPIELDMTVAQALDILASERRRRLIRLLPLAFDEGESGPYFGVGDLTNILIKSNLGLRAGESVPTDAYRRLYVALVQTHAPLLDEHGVIEYYERPQKLTATEQAVHLAQLLEMLEDVCTPAPPATGGDE